MSLKSKKAKVVIRPSKKLKAGRYTLRITVTQADRADTAVSRTIRLK